VLDVACAVMCLMLPCCYVFDVACAAVCLMLPRWLFDDLFLMFDVCHEEAALSLQNVRD
jgi:hypothetical protein